MSKFVYKPFWSYDVVKTEKWLTNLSEKGYSLKNIYFKLRLFEFEKVNPDKFFYRIVYGKNSNGFPQNYIESNQYDGVSFTKNFYILKTYTNTPKLEPSYNQLLERNRKIKFWVGNVLLFELVLFLIPLLLILVSIISFSVEISQSEQEFGNTTELFEGIVVLSILLGYCITNIWMIYTYFKLGKSNLKLEKECGDSLNLSLTIPKDTILSKQQLKELRKTKLLVKKTRLAWFYAPDKAEKWLEKMEYQGYHLLQMSRLGSTFYFLKSDSKKVKYHIDFQKSTDSNYFNMNKQVGWKLFFTSLTRFFALSVWAKEYTDTSPMFYSDNDTKNKHAKTYAIFYSVIYLPLSVFLFLCVIYFASILMKIENIHWSIYTYLIPMIILGIVLTYFSILTILYYKRVKKETSN